MNREGEKSLVFEICFAAVILVSLATFAMGLAAGSSWRASIIRKQAVEAGHAEWVVANDGTTTFKWKARGEE